MRDNKWLIFLFFLPVAQKSMGQGDSLLRRNSIKEVLCYQCFVMTGRKDSCDLEARYDPRKTVADKTVEPELTKSPDDSSLSYYTKTYIYNYDNNMQVRQTFNRQDQLIEKLTLDNREHPDTSVFIRILYLYDDRSRLKRVLTLGRNNEIASEKSYDYDASGALKYQDDAPGLKTTIQYNANGSMSEIKAFDPFSRNTRITKYLYDDKKEYLVREEEYVNGALSSYRKYEYKK